MMCDYCHHPIPERVHPYTLKLELFPAVEPSLDLTVKELESDLPGAMARLIQQMAAMDDREVERQEKLMYFAHRFTLCPACRDRLASQIEALLPPPLS